MSINRRNFLKISAITAGTLMGGSKKLSASEGKDNFAHTYSMLNDSARCIGCRACQSACKNSKGFEATGEDKRYDMPLDLNSRNHTLIKLYQGKKEKSFVKIQCMHCNDPGCVSACPVSALIKQVNGVVTYDKDKCIGCRYCMIACPFDVPTFEYDKPFPEIMKCDFCKDYLAEGKPTECARVCPTGAIVFGTREEMLKLARKRIAAEPDKYVNHIYGEKEVGGTSVLYLSSVPFEKLGLQTLETDAVPDLAEGIQHGIFKYFIPPVALYGALGIYSLISKKKDQTGGEE